MRSVLSMRLCILMVAGIMLLGLAAGCVAPTVAPAPAATAGASTAPVAAAAATAVQPGTSATAPSTAVSGSAAQPVPAGTQQSAQPIVIPTQAAGALPGGSGLEGQWEGPLKVAGQELNTIVRFKGGGSDLTGTMDIPAQGAKDIPLAKISQQGAKVHFEAFTGARLATYEGEIKPDGSLAGDFQQAGYKGSFVLLRAAAAAPTAAVLYKQEEVTYKNNDVTLAGTLTLPPSGGPFPAVVLITGSGPQNRDEELLGFQPFRLLADYFTRNGIAVLRVDDRGVGGSTGDVTQATSEDFAGDVLAGVHFLKARPDINPQQIGLLGHSEGGLIAPMVAARSSDVAYIVLLAGPGLTGEQVMARQLEDIMKASGASQTEIDKAKAVQKRTVEAIKTGKGWDELRADWVKQARTQLESLPADQLQAMGGLDKAVAGVVEGQVAGVNNPWFKFFITYDPTQTLAKVKVPVLAVFGGKDTQVAAGPNTAAIRAALEQGGNKQLTVKEFPEANHLFQQATTGSPEEYAGLKKEFVPGLLDYLTTWIKSVVK